MKKINLLGIHPFVLEQYLTEAGDDVLVKILKSLTYPITVECFGKKKARLTVVPTPDFQHFLIIEDSVYNAAWFITDDEKINEYCKNFWNAFKIESKNG